MLEHQVNNTALTFVSEEAMQWSEMEGTADAKATLCWLLVSHQRFHLQQHGRAITTIHYNTLWSAHAHFVGSKVIISAH
jgi:hypothetical protein